MKAMDKNKDGTVSRTEFMEYMGKQFDMMDQNKDKMLNTKEFMDKKMMQSTFPVQFPDSPRAEADPRQADRSRASASLVFRTV